MKLFIQNILRTDLNLKLIESTERFGVKKGEPKYQVPGQQLASSVHTENPIYCL